MKTTMKPHRPALLLLRLLLITTAATDAGEPASGPLSRQRRLVIPKKVLWFIRGQTQSVRVDWCEIYDCQGDDKAWIGTTKYLCKSPLGGRSVSWADCPWHTGTGDWAVGYTDPTDRLNRLSIVQEASAANCVPKQCNPLVITLRDPRCSDAGRYVLYAYVSWEDPSERLYFSVQEPPNTSLIKELKELRKNSKLSKLNTDYDILFCVLGSAAPLLAVVGISAWWIWRRRRNRPAQLPPTRTLDYPATNPYYAGENDLARSALVL